MGRSSLRLGLKVTFLILALLCCANADHASAQSPKPNISGKWKLNPSRSKLSPYHRPGSETCKIKHAEPKLQIELNGITYSYVIDGKEHVAYRSEKPDRVTRAKAHWEGDTLVIEKQEDLGPGGTTWVSRYDLSQDSKSLVVTQHITRSVFGAPFEESLVYDK